MSHAPPEPAPGADVSRETAARLDAFEAELRRWNARINLVSRGSLADLHTRHIADSAQLLDLAPPDARLWLDFGSGGGFPGLVVAILAAERMPALRMTLVDSDARKTAFLRAAAQRLGLDVDVETARIESLPPIPADVVSARAVAPLDRLFALCAAHGTPRTRYLFPKGAAYRDELATDGLHRDLPLQIVPSRTHADGVILCFGG